MINLIIIYIKTDKLSIILINMKLKDYIIILLYNYMSYIINNSY